MATDVGRANVAVSDIDPRFHSEISAHLGELDLSYCFQCGVCSGSCPTVERMEYGPRRIMQMVRLGLSDSVLRSKDMWMCVSCYSCSARCPQGVKVAEVMNVLRNLSLAGGTAKDEEAIFSRVFAGLVQRYGRLYEPELLIRYYASRADLPGLLKQTGLALTMLRKGKIALLPERIKGTGELANIVERLKADGGADS
jgi:heterodisulfide reductase subunit C2